MAAETHYYKLSGLNNANLLSHRAAGQSLGGTAYVLSSGQGAEGNGEVRAPRTLICRSERNQREMKYANYQHSREKVTRATVEGKKRQEGSIRLRVCCRRIRRASGKRRQKKNS